MLAIGVAAVALVFAMLAVMIVVMRNRRARVQRDIQDGPHER
jgi:cell division protein FtsL